MSFTVIDWILSVIIAVLAFIGLFKGFINNIFGKLAVILGILLAILFYDNLATLVLQPIQNETLRNILSFLIIFVLVFLIIKIIQMIISKAFELSILKSLDRTLGFFFGVIEGLVIVELIIFLLTLQPFVPVENLFSGSFYYSLLQLILSNSKDVVTNV